MSDDTPDVSQTELDELLEAHVSDDRRAIGTSATASAIQAAAATLDETIYRGAFGTADPESDTPAPVEATTPVDIASLTKPLVGATLTIQAVDEGLVDWTTPVAELIDEWSDHPDDDATDVTLLHLLNHTSGLPEWKPFFEDHPVDPDASQARHNRRAIIEEIARTPLAGPPGEHHEYSDLGYILLAEILEKLFDSDLARLAHRRIFEPLNLDDTTYVDGDVGPARLTDAVVTEDCPHRDRVVRGTVHDTNTNVMGGVSAHAGVFSTADDLLAFGRHLLAIDRNRSPQREPIVSRKNLQFAWSDRAGSSVGHHRAGWDTPSGARSTAGRGFDPDDTVGHLGFTGTSLWVERSRGVVSVLLTNRVYPSRDNDRINDLRIDFQETILPPPETNP